MKVLDNYYLPAKLTVNKGSTVTWKWSSVEAYDVHDVKLKSGPPGVRKFHSEPAAGDFSYKRTLKRPGRYKVVCTLHEEMDDDDQGAQALICPGAGLGSPSVAAMSLCPACGSSLLQPLRSRPGQRRRDAGRHALPRVLHVDAGVLQPSELAELDKRQAASRELLVDAYERSVTESMEALAICLRAALALDLVDADDFAPRRAA